MQNNGNGRFCRPPLCPRPEKATTIAITPPAESLMTQLKKNQRATHQPSSKQSSSPKGVDSLHPASSTSTLNCFQNRQEKANVLRTEYQQYSRKNYFKIKREDFNDPHIDSRMTEKVVPDRTERDELSRNVKSKSAVNYAKYFIKTISNIPTEPSSQEQNQVAAGQQGEPGLKLPIQVQNPSQYSHENGRKTHRAKISQRLKSLKTNRTKSNRKNSNQRDLVPSIQKRSRKQVSGQKINGNIKNLNANQNLVAKMKARSRNRRIVLKVRQLNLTREEDSISLMLNSKLDKSHTAQIEVVEKIELHLELLNLLPAYVKQFKQIYEEIECWDELLFLTYKKFYLERIKIHQALFGNSSNYSPFRFPFAAVSPHQLKNLSATLEGIRLQQRVGAENQLIKRALQELYNHIIEKSGKYINLLQDDNFSEEVYWLMGEEVRLLEEGERDHMRELRKRRITLIIKCCFMIAFLNGESLDIELLLTGEEYSQTTLLLFEDFLNRLVQ